MLGDPAAGEEAAGIVDEHVGHGIEDGVDLVIVVVAVVGRESCGLGEEGGDPLSGAQVMSPVVFDVCDGLALLVVDSRHEHPA